MEPKEIHDEPEAQAEPAMVQAMQDALRDGISITRIAMRDFYAAPTPRAAAQARAMQFINHIINGVFEGGDFGGGELQDLAVQYGLLKPVEMQAPCSKDHCQCADNDAAFPTICLRKTYPAFAAAQLVSGEVAELIDAAFEAHRKGQTKIVGMPGLAAKPSFAAGYRAALSSQSQGDKRDKEDAERYRWLRAADADNPGDFCVCDDSMNAITGDELDKSIDAAMSGKDAG